MTLMAAQTTLATFSLLRPGQPCPGVRDAVFRILDMEEEFRCREAAFRRGNLWRLTHLVSALLNRKVNPETVARRRREYWKLHGGMRT